MTTLPLAPGYTVRPARMEDAEAAHALTVLSGIEETGEPSGVSLIEFRDFWRELDLGTCTWLIHAPGGSLAGYALLDTAVPVRLITGSCVHPAHFNRGIGTTLLRLAESRACEHIDRAPAGARVVLYNSTSATNDDASSLLTREGFARDRFFLRMEANLDTAPPPPVWPEGITVRAMEPGEDGRVFHATLEEAMQGHYGYAPLEFDQWKEGRMGEAFDPSLWFLAMEGDEPAGAAICIGAEGIGWVDTLAVRQPWRRRGIGLALLRHAAGAFHRQGLRKYALTVDSESPTGATRLYERAGMRQVHSFAIWLKELRAEGNPASP